MKKTQNTQLWTTNSVREIAAKHEDDQVLFFGRGIRLNLKVFETILNIHAMIFEHDFETFLEYFEFHPSTKFPP